MSDKACASPKWFYKTGTHPPTDDAYFENMTRVIFQAGLSWNLIERKWSNFQKVFESFDIQKVAQFNEEDLERLMLDDGIVRNRKKISATIYNAKQFQTIREEFGSFQTYVRTLGKSNNYALVVKELGKRFKHLGPSSTRIFLGSVGEDVRHMPEG